MARGFLTPKSPLLRLSISSGTRCYSFFPISVSVQTVLRNLRGWHASKSNTCRRDFSTKLYAELVSPKHPGAKRVLKGSEASGAESFWWKPTPPPLVSEEESKLLPNFTLRHPDQTPEPLRYRLRCYLYKKYANRAAAHARVGLGYRDNNVWSHYFYVDTPKHWAPNHSSSRCQLVWEPSTLSVVLYELGVGILPETRRYLTDLKHTCPASMISRVLVDEGHLQQEDVERLRGPEYQTDYDLDRLKAQYYWQSATVNDRTGRPPDARLCLNLRISVGGLSVVRRNTQMKSGLWSPRLHLALDPKLEQSLKGKKLRVILHVDPDRCLGLHLVEVVGHPGLPGDRPLSLRRRFVAGIQGPSIDDDSHVLSRMLRDFVARVDAHRASIPPTSE